MRARTTDPITSHMAAAAIQGEASRQRVVIRKLVEEHPGLTSQELAEHSDLDRYQIARRLPELRAKGKVIMGHYRPCKVSGRQAHTWVPA